MPKVVNYQIHPIGVGKNSNYLRNHFLGITRNSCQLSWLSDGLYKVSRSVLTSYISAVVNISDSGSNFLMKLPGVEEKEWLKVLNAGKRLQAIDIHTKYTP